MCEIFLEDAEVDLDFFFDYLEENEWVGGGVGYIGEELLPEDKLEILRDHGYDI